MNMQRNLTAGILVLAACALLAALPSSGATPAAAAAPATAPVLASAPEAASPAMAPAAACGQALDLTPPAGALAASGRLGNPSGPVCGLDADARGAKSPALAQAVVYHGFCRCSCTRIPDCNTSADCGGSACLKAITCC